MKSFQLLPFSLATTTGPHPGQHRVSPPHQASQGPYAAGEGQRWALGMCARLPSCGHFRLTPRTPSKAPCFPVGHRLELGGRAGGSLAGNGPAGEQMGIHRQHFPERKLSLPACQAHCKHWPHGPHLAELGAQSASHCAVENFPLTSGHARRHKKHVTLRCSRGPKGWRGIGCVVGQERGTQTCTVRVLGGLSPSPRVPGLLSDLL